MWSFFSHTGFPCGDLLQDGRVIYTVLFGSGPQVETKLLFAVAGILLLCSSGWLLAVRLNSAALRGVGWLAGAAALCGISFSLPAFYQHVSVMLSLVVASELLLLAHVLFELAFLKLMDGEYRQPIFGWLLIGIETILLPVLAYDYHSYRWSTVVSGSLLSVQLIRNVVLILRKRKKMLGAPVLFTAASWIFFLILLTTRSLVVIQFWSPDSPLNDTWFQLINISASLLSSLWTISGLFWLATSKLALQLETMAGTDPLTRLYNRRVFQEWMHREFMRSLRTSTPFSLLVIDLDHFKKINDKLGHSAGDEVLRICVERMQDSIRGIDVLGRWGGEEFVALLPRATLEAAELVAERIRKNMELPMVLQAGGAKRTVHATVSLGLTSYRGVDDTVEAMFDRADRALYAAKESGRNRTLAAA